MGLLQDGRWVDRWYDTSKAGGRFERKASQFRNWVTSDGQPGASGKGGFKAEAGRYHLTFHLRAHGLTELLSFEASKALRR